MKTTKILSLLFAVILLFTVSCNSDEIDNPTLSYIDGFFISNEGNFGDQDANVSYITRDLNYKQDNVFSSANNGEILGDVLQTIRFYGDYGFLVVNNSNKIVVVNRYTFKKVAEITEQIHQPRSIAFANGNIYVTNYDFAATQNVTVYKASDLSFVKKIDFTEPVEQIVEAGGNIFVQNASYGFGNKITYVNTSTNTIQSEVIVPNGDITKTISAGNRIYTIASTATDSYIYKISSTGTLDATTVLTGIPNATNLQIDNGKFYFSSANKIYSMDITSTTVPTTPLVTAVDGGLYYTLYGFNVIDGKIFTSDVKGFTQASEITVYNASNGVKISTFTAGKGTNGFVSNF